MFLPTGVPRNASATPKRSPGGRGGEQWVWMSMMGTSLSIRRRHMFSTRP
jgi:hypothetical protein